MGFNSGFKGLKRVQQNIRNNGNILLTDQTSQITQSVLVTAKLSKQWFLTQNTDPLAPLWRGPATSIQHFIWINRKRRRQDI